MADDTEKILVVDDNTGIRHKLLEFLAAEGYRLEEAANGIEALEKARSFGPDMVLLDIVMPEMDGLKVLRDLRENALTRDVPVIMITSQSHGKDVKTGFDLGANDYVTKPFDPEVLLARVRRHLEIKRRFDQIKEERELLFVTNQLITSLHAKKKTRDVLFCLVQKIAEFIQVKRCSVIRIQDDGTTGVVEATSDGPDIRDLTIDLKKYPEILAALGQKDMVVIPNVTTDERVAAVREILHQVGCHSLVVVPIVHGDDLIGTLLLNTARARDTFNDREVRFLKGIAKAAKTALLNAEYFERAEKRAAEEEAGATTHDPLTRLCGYYKFLEEAEKEIYRAKRYKSRLSLILVDIEQLRDVNQRHGQDKGDLALQEVARTIADSIRKSDLAARCHGDDFAVLLPETSQIGATVKAKQLQKMVRKNPTLHELGVSILVGVSSMEETEVHSPVDLIHAAEIELERAKTGPFAL